HIPIELVEVRQIAREEDVLPERHTRADQHEERDEDVSGGVAEITQQVALEDRPDHVNAERPEPAGAGRIRRPLLAGRLGFERGPLSRPLVSLRRGAGFPSRPGSPIRTDPRRFTGWSRWQESPRSGTSRAPRRRPAGSLTDPAGSPSPPTAGSDRLGR